MKFWSPTEKLSSYVVTSGFCFSKYSPFLSFHSVQALYGSSSGSLGNFNYVSYIYLLAPISLVIINPIGFFMMEYHKQSSRQTICHLFHCVQTVASSALRDRDCSTETVFSLNVLPLSYLLSREKVTLRHAPFIVLRTLRGVLLNPIIFMTALGILVNVIVYFGINKQVQSSTGTCCHSNIILISHF